MCCPCIPSALPAAAQLGYSTPMIVTGRPAPAGLRLFIVISFSSYTRFRRVRGNKGVASLPATRGRSLRMQRRSRRAVYSANLLSEPGAPGAAGAAKGQSLRRVGSDEESMDRRSCLSLLSGLWKYRAHQSARDLPGDTAANALRDGRAGFFMRGGLHVAKQLGEGVQLAAEFTEGHYNPPFTSSGYLSASSSAWRRRYVARLGM